MPRGANADGLKDADEGALAHADLRPRDNTDDQRETRQVKQNQGAQGGGQGLGHGRFRVGGLAGSAADDFDSKETEKAHDDSQADALPAVWQESTMPGEVREADPREPPTK